MTNQEQKIIDRFGRVHDYLRISLTERCNLRCTYCMPEEGIPLRDKAEFMSTEELISIANVFVKLGVKKIRLTGGEPLVKKGFENLIRKLAELPVEIALTTNAILIDKYIDVLKEANVKKINVSLDSLKSDVFNAISRRKYFGKIMENIDLLILNEFHIKINVVLIKGTNENEIVDFLEWANTKNTHIQFIEFMPFDGNNWNLEQNVSFKEIMKAISYYYGIENILKIEDAKNDTARNYKIINSTATFGIISSVTNPFCSTCNRIRLTADGKIKNCLFSQTETDLLTSFRKGEEIEELILNSIHSKYKERGGLEEFSNDSVKKIKNRSMTVIGG